MVCGGGFWYAGGKVVTGFAEYHNGQFDSIATFIGGGPEDLLVVDSSVYIVGRFASINDEQGTEGIALWNRSNNSWHSISSGFPPLGEGPVLAIAEYQGDIYIGGKFSGIGGANSNRIARWDGQQWHSVGGGVGGPIPNIKALAVYQGELYVGGGFSVGTADGGVAHNIARWDGQDWHAVGNSVNGSVAAMCVDTANDQLIMGGGLYGEIGGDTLRYIAAWDGESFHSIGGGMNNGVVALTFYHDELYAAGGFWEAGGVPANNIAHWNGWEWKPCGAGTNGTTQALGVYQDTLFVGGYFTEAGGMPASKIAKWWAPYDSTLSVKEPEAGSRKLEVFPNPNKGELTIAWKALKEKATLSIRDMQGREVHRAGLAPRQDLLKVDTSVFSKGVYSCVLHQKGKRLAVERLVVE